MVAPNPITQAKHLEHTRLHRETYIAVLNSVLQTRGEKRQFADTVGITPQYLFRLLDSLDDLCPSPELAIHIADAVPLPSKSRGELLHHLRSAYPHHADAFLRNPGGSLERLTPDQTRDVILIIGNYEHRSLYSTDTEAVRNAYTMLLKLGTWTLARLDPNVTPQHYVGISASLHCTASALNMPVKSMWFARTGLAVAKNTAFWHSSELRSHRIGVLIDAWDGLATAWHNLGQPENALECVQHAKQIALNLSDKAERNRLLPGIIMEELNTYTIHPNFSIKAAELARDQGLNSLYSTVSNRASLDLVASLIERNMIESYVQHGTPRSLRKAGNYITDNFSDDRLSRFGPLVHTMHLRTCAKLHWKTRNQQACAASLGKAYELSTEAGLIHQQAEIRKEISELERH